MELLSDHGLWLRSIHLVSAISWVGLLWFLDWTLQPAARQMGLHEQRSLWCHLLPRALWWLRWSAAVAWLSGLTYAAFLVAQSNQGLLGWFHGPLRGKWVGMGFLLSTAMVFHVWFVAWPAQARLIAKARRADGSDEIHLDGNRARFSNRFATYLSIPLVIAMQAGLHGGELTPSLPVDFLPAAVVVLVLGVAMAGLISHVVAPLVGR